MALMQLTFLTASLDAEKKNDEPQLIPTNQTTAAPAETQLHNASELRNAVKEPDLKFASKPTVPFDQLKVKSNFSIQELQKVAGPAVQAITETVVAAPIQNKPVNEADMLAAMRKLGEEKMTSGARQLGTILTTSHAKLQGTQILLSILSETQKEQMNASRQEVIDVLRKRLQNNELSLEISITDLPVQNKAFKPHDIFKAMAERNPALNELKKRFDLEIDY
jgi:DNA polymerase-3 subunit gamma/tau